MEFLKDDKKYVVTVKKEVILSAGKLLVEATVCSRLTPLRVGSLQSPQILELSGM